MRSAGETRGQDGTVECVLENGWRTDPNTFQHGTAYRRGHVNLLVEWFVEHRALTPLKYSARESRIDKRR